MDNNKFEIYGNSADMNDPQVQEFFRNMNAPKSDAVVLAMWAYNWSSGFINEVPWPKGCFGSLEECRAHLQYKWDNKLENGGDGCNIAIDFFLELDPKFQDTLINWYRGKF